MPVNERFQNGAQDYAAYLETVEGRLRTDLAFGNLEDFLPLQANPSLCALDLGCGTGATAVRLARFGIHVTLLDSSPAMLDIAKRAAREAGVTDKAVLQHGDATQLAKLFHARSFDVILCHVADFSHRSGANYFNGQSPKPRHECHLARRSRGIFAHILRKNDLRTTAGLRRRGPRHLRPCGLDNVIATHWDLVKQASPKASRVTAERMMGKRGRATTG